jgi:adenine-specific DNA-methyltransferase
MAKQLQKLEITWIGKGNEPQLEPRILIEDPNKSFGDPKTENMLIEGDNLLALKALEQNFSGKIKCIYIDPPYNTGNAFEHYDDGIEHSLWLNLMYQRLVILKNLLSEDGVIFVQIDDSEGSYLKVLMDEIFGRANFETTFYVQVRYGNKTLNEDNNYQKLIEHILVYKKPMFKPNKKTIEYSIDKFCWKITEKTDGTIETIGGRKVLIFKEGEYEIEEIEPSLKGLKETWATGSLVKQGGSAAEFFDLHLSSRKNIDGLNTLYKVVDMGTQGDGLGYRYITGPKKATAAKGKFYTGIPIDKVENIKTNTAIKEVPISNFYDYSGSFGNCRLEGGVSFNGGKKPEELIAMLLEIGSNEGDLVLDSFLGSGTTAAVAHKIKRKYIGIELGEQANTHCLPRLKSIISGSDQSGISNSFNWKGGGGFKFYTLAPSLVQKDKYGTEIINPEYNPNMLAAAMAKQEGFRYQPDENNYWKQGISSEKDFIFTTTQFVTFAILDKLAEELNPNESLLICCKSFAKGCNSRHTNITIKKIPQMLLGRCEFGKEDYSFNIVNLPIEQDEEIEDYGNIENEVIKTKSKTKKKDDENQSTLF